MAVADLLWSPALVARPQSRPMPGDWSKGRAEAARLLETLNPPADHRPEWAAVEARLPQQPASAWSVVRLEATDSTGIFSLYQNRLSGLRLRQLQARADQLRTILEKNDYPAYCAALARESESSGPLRLALTLQPLAQVGQAEIVPYPLWWEVLAAQSNLQALRAGARLARGKTPEIPHRWENGVCVCWTPGPDGRDDGGILQASLLEAPASAPTGDWIYRFR